MKNLMKRSFALLLALVMLLSMAACGSSEPAATEAPKADAPAAEAPAAPAVEEDPFDSIFKIFNTK